MPTDSATKVVQINAPFADVLATIRDVQSQAEWIRDPRGRGTGGIRGEWIAGNRPAQGVRDRRHG